MEERRPEDEDKKWSDMLKANQKMVLFAREELKDGNLLNAKSIVESLSKTFQQNAKSFPPCFRQQVE